MKSYDFLDNICSIIKNSSEYKEFLEDTDFGRFTKADLYNAINNNIVMATNYNMGVDVSYSKRMTGNDSVEISISCIKNEYDKYGTLVGLNILEDEYACNELGFSITYLDGELREVIDFIYIKMNEIINDCLEPIGRLINIPNTQYISKPENINEIINYKKYLGYTSKKIFYNEVI